jgi:hypothetical protein
LVLALVATGACGGSGDNGGGGGSSASTGTGSTNSGGNAAGIGTGGGITFDGGAATGNTGGSLEDGGACAAETAKGEQVPLDLYIMLDSSGSMLDTTASGPSKWDAVKQAIAGFVAAPGSAGLGVGLQFFPLNKQGVPDVCSNDNQCGAGAPCLLKTCLGGGTIQPCTNNSQCGFLGTCADLGGCTLDPSIVCAPVGSTACGAAGQCVKLTTSFCANATECSNVRYATPAVNIATLPGNAAAINASMNAKAPNGNTPTGPALQGAIDHAKQFAGQNPGHTVVTVLATDGLPTSCTMTNISQIAALAQAGKNGTPSISTFVIGVFAPADTAAAQNLNSIAAAGGTNTAFIINTSGNVTQQFLQALDQIKGKALPCEFKVPAPSSGQVDYNKVNVQVTSSGGNTSLLYVGDASKCDPTNGGWYYDIDPVAGTPTKIVVCPSTCTAFKGQTGAQVDILIGCKTNIAPPR